MRAGQEIYFEGRNALRVVTSMSHYMVNCIRLLPCGLLQIPKTCLKKIEALPSRQCQYLSQKVTQNITGLESFSTVSCLMASICTMLLLPSQLSWATVMCLVFFPFVHAADSERPILHLHLVQIESVGCKVFIHIQKSTFARGNRGIHLSAVRKSLH